MIVMLCLVYSRFLQITIITVSIFFGGASSFFLRSHIYFDRYSPLRCLSFPVNVVLLSSQAEHIISRG
jgi:hypothetical protein